MSTDNLQWLSNLTDSRFTVYDLESPCQQHPHSINHTTHSQPHYTLSLNNPDTLSTKLHTLSTTLHTLSTTLYTLSTPLHPLSHQHSDKRSIRIWTGLAACFGVSKVARKARVDSGPKRESRVQLLLPAVGKSL